MMQRAEKMFYNGKIYTVDSKESVQTAFCIYDDRFMAVGSDEEMLALCDESTEKVDLKGQVVVPGLIDTHLHVVHTGTIKMQLDLHGMDKKEILEQVKQVAQTLEPGKWIQGWGWINDKWDDPGFPTKEELDEVAPDVPVFLNRGCGHMSWVNSKAIELVGITEDTPNPPGGEIIKNEDGSIRGVVTDQAQDLFMKKVPVYDDEDQKKINLLAQDEFLKFGLTSVHDMGASPHDLDIRESLYADGRMKVRTYNTLRVPGRPWYDEMYEKSMEYLKAGIRVGMYDNRMTVRGYKISGDGSLGARSAWMVDDYDDRPGHKGDGKWTDEQWDAVCYEAHKRGFQICYHGIGDAANRQALNSFEKVLKMIPNPDHRHRIEHAQILQPDDIPRFKELGVIPTFQTIFLHTDKNVAEARIGDRVKYAYAWRTMIDQGNVIPNGTDCPVESCNPYMSMYCAVTRMDEFGEPEGGWYPDEAMTRMEALKSYTIWAAYSGFEENLKGSIETGKLADFVIIDKDIMECPESEIKDIQALETYIGGELVYKK